MATKVTHYVDCDHCGTVDDVQTHTVKVDRKAWDIDFCPEGLAEFQAAMDALLAKARPVGRKSATAASARPAALAHPARKTTVAKKAAAKKS